MEVGFICGDIEDADTEPGEVVTIERECWTSGEEMGIGNWGKLEGEPSGWIAALFK
jgi:hypothetical protein